MKISYPNLETALKAQKMFQLRQQTLLSIMDGKYKNARKIQKELAKNAIEDFDTYTTLPKVNFTNIPLKLWFSMLWKSIKFRIFKAFTKNSPEEKILNKKIKTYKKTLTKEDINKKTINIKMPF